MWYYCRVTRMLVSYDETLNSIFSEFFIAGSPECWWVTTEGILPIPHPQGLQGHQNVGELRPRLYKFACSASKIAGSPECWWVTTYLVVRLKQLVQLQGHQNVGELRLIHYSELIVDWKLQGHQNVGELRHLNCCSVSYCNCFAFKM